MANFTADQLRRLTRLGAIARLNELREEEAALRREFPELFGSGRRIEAAAAGGSKKRAGRRRAMSAAARKAVSERMRKYWAERRKGKAGK